MSRHTRLTSEQEAQIINMLNSGKTLKEVQTHIAKDGIQMTEMGLCMVRKRFRTLTDSAKNLEKMVTNKRINNQIKTGELCDRTILVGTEIMRIKMEEIYKKMQEGTKVSNYELYMVNSFIKTMGELSKNSTPQFEVTQSQIYQNLKDRYLKKDKEEENKKEEEKENKEAEITDTSQVQEKATADVEVH